MKPAPHNRRSSGLGLAASGLLLLWPALASAQVPFKLLSDQNNTDSARNIVWDPGFFNGIGTPGKNWELQSETVYSTSRILSERFSLAAILPFSRLTGLVFRAEFGADDDPAQGFYSIPGVILSVGDRYRTSDNQSWIEFGGRLIPGWPGPTNSQPQAIHLALTATLESMAADDATWLPFSSLGWQVYFIGQSQVDITSRPVVGALGARYGVRTSLAPLEVNTWLGAQPGIVGNLFVDVFADVIRINDLLRVLGRRSGLNLRIQVGGHAQLSLSSVWPSSAPLPFSFDGFLGWSPVRWASAQIFYGIALVPPTNGIPSAVPTTNPYGLKLTFYVP